MVKYRRIKICGGTYFFTLALYDRRLPLLTDHIDELRKAFAKVKTQYPFIIDALVILPDHLHTIWTLPQNDSNYSLRWQRIKSLFTQALTQKEIFIPKDQQGRYYLWQKRFWEHVIRHELDLENHINYIHYNPVKHGNKIPIKKNRMANRVNTPSTSGPTIKRLAKR